MQITPTTYITGDLNTYTFAFTTGQELKSGVTLQIDFPPEVKLTHPLACAPLLSSLTQVTCTEIYDCLTPGTTKVPTSKLKAVLTFIVDDFP